MVADVTGYLSPRIRWVILAFPSYHVLLQVYHRVHVGSLVT